MRDFYQKLECHDSIIIFGASKIGRLIENEIRPYCDNMEKTLCYADNSSEKHDIKKGILKPNEAFAKFPNALWIIASNIHSIPMLKDLHHLGIEDKNIIKDPPAYIVHREKRAEILKRTTPQDALFQFEVDIAHHCNLNCAGCNAFSPLVKAPHFADFSVFDRDLERMSFLLNKELSQLYLLGGEPLLNPQINEFVASSRKHFPCTRIYIITNGMLLHRMPKAFWDMCQETKTIISVTGYPISLNYDELLSIARIHGVDLEFFTKNKDTKRMKMSNFALDPSGLQNPHESFCNCEFANKCVKLKRGKLTTCSPILNIDFFNEAFGTNIKLCSDDYIDIYKAKSKQEVLSRLSEPMSFCRFCDVKKRTLDIPWHVSKREISEWVKS